MPDGRSFFEDNRSGAGLPIMSSPFFWKTLRPLFRFRTFRRRAERHIGALQHQIGIGDAGRVVDSGERVVLQMLRRMAATQPTRPLIVFDVGANKGQFLKLILDGLIGHQAHIHCFEPSPTTFALLMEKHGNTANVTFNYRGLGRDTGQMELYSDALGSGLASLTKRNLDHLKIPFNRSETVRIDTLDAYCRVQAVNAIDLLKIDVEGHELDVLLGAVEMLRSGKVRMVTFEFGGCNIDTRTYLRDYWEFFGKIGMKSFSRIMPSGMLFPIERYSERLEQFVTTNFLVVLDS